VFWLARHSSRASSRRSSGTLSVIRPELGGFFFLFHFQGYQHRDAGKQTIIREEILTNYPGSAIQSSDMAVGVLMVLFRAILGPQWRPRAAHFAREVPKDVTIYKRLFKCPLQFDSDFNGIVCYTADLDRTNPLADPAMATFAQSFPGCQNCCCIQFFDG
jgi:hypothetical protein